MRKRRIPKSDTFSDAESAPLAAEEREVFLGAFWKIAIVAIILIEGYKNIFARCVSPDHCGDLVHYVLCGNSVLCGTLYPFGVSNTWPPFFSFFVVPLAGLANIHMRLAAAFWYAINVALIFACARIVRDLLLGARRVVPQFFYLLPVLFTLRFFLNNLGHHNINILVMFLVLAALKQFTNGRDILAGFLLGLATVLKVSPVYFIIYFAFRREWKVTASSFATAIGLSAFPALFFGFAKNAEYLKTWFFEIAMKLGRDANVGNQSLGAAITRFFSHTSDPSVGLYLNVADLSPAAISVLTAIVSVTLFGFVLWLCRKRIARRAQMKTHLEHALIFVCMTLLTPLAWEAHFVSLFFPAAALFAFLLWSGDVIGAVGDDRASANDSIRALRTSTHASASQAIIASIGTLPARTVWLLTQRVKILWIIAALAFVAGTLTVDGLWGNAFGDIFLAFSCVTLSAAFIAAALIIAVLLPSSVFKVYDSQPRLPTLPS